MGAAGDCGTNRKVNIMEQEKFERNITRISAWMDENDAGAMTSVVEQMLILPHEDDNDRDRIWAGIRSVLGMLPNSPIKRGRGSSLPDEVQAVLDNVANGVKTAARAYFNAGDGTMSVLLKKHGKSGGGLYADADEYADAQATAIVASLKTRFKENIWDGTPDGLMNQTFPVQEVNEEEWSPHSPVAPFAS